MGLFSKERIVHVENLIQAHLPLALEGDDVAVPLLIIEVKDHTALACWVILEELVEDLSVAPDDL